MRQYGDAECATVSLFVAKLMEVADFKPNVKCGTERFKVVFLEVLDLAPPAMRPCLADYVQGFAVACFSSHVRKLGDVVAEWRVMPMQP